MTCQVCNIINRRENKVFEDKKLYAFLSPEPMAEGHIIVATKKHATLLTDINDEDSAHIFKVSQLLSGTLFEALGSEGTNILMQNGVAAGQQHAHLMINIIPRMPSDGLSFEWQQKQIPEDKMNQIEGMIKSSQKIVQSAPKPVESAKKEKKAEIIVPKHDNYLYRQLRRIP